MSGQWTFLGDGAVEGPGPLERPAVLLDQVGKRLFVAPKNPAPSPFQVKFWALSTKTGSWQEHVTLSAPTAQPGVYQGQIRDGRWKQYTYESPETIPYSTIELPSGTRSGEKIMRGPVSTSLVMGISSVSGINSP